jgi:hypothetical protein
LTIEPRMRFTSIYLVLSPRSPDVFLLLLFLLPLSLPHPSGCPTFGVHLHQLTQTPATRDLERWG